MTNAHIARVVGKGARGPLGSTPERLTSVRQSVCRQAVQQLLDGIVVFIFKLQPRPCDAFFEREWLVGHKVRNNLLHLFCLLTRVLEGRLEEVGLGEILIDRFRRPHKQCVEFLATPL